MNELTVDLSKKQPIEYLKERADPPDPDIMITAKGIIKALPKIMAFIIGGIFGSIAANDAIFHDIRFAIGVFICFLLSGGILFFGNNLRKEKQVHNEDMKVMAQSQVEIVETLNDHFKIKITETMQELKINLEIQYSDTIRGLSDQINNLVAAMIEEKEKIHIMLNMMTTDNFENPNNFRYESDE